MPLGNIQSVEDSRASGNGADSQKERRFNVNLKRLLSQSKKQELSLPLAFDSQSLRVVWKARDLLDGRST